MACQFLLFHESTEVIKDVSLMHGYENGKHEGYGNERNVFLPFLFLKDRRSEEERCVGGGENMW